MGLSKIKLGNTVLSSELEIEGHDLVIFDRCRRGEGAACFVKKSISYNQKHNFCINTKIISIVIFYLNQFQLVLYRGLLENTTSKIVYNTHSVKLMSFNPRNAIFWVTSM